MNIEIKITGLNEREAAAVLDKITSPSAQMELPLSNDTSPAEAIAHAKQTLDNVKGAVVGDTVIPAPSETPSMTVEDFPSAPAAPTAEADEPAEDVELDKNGVPWDERIHSGNGKKTSKGVWQRRRGIQDTEFDEVMAELKAAQAPSAPEPVEVVAEQPAETPTAPVAPETPAAPPAPTPAAPPAPAAAPVAEAARDYAGLMLKIQNDFAAGTVDANYANTIVDRINAGFKTDVKTLPDISGNAEMVDYAWQCIDVDTQARAA